MQTEEEDTLAAHQWLMRRKGAALESLNSRIARLAIALGLALDTDVGLRLALSPRPALAAHQHAFQEALRALLALRYQMEKQLVDEVGGPAMHGLVVEVEQHMERVGFRHGADGMREA